MSVSTSRFDPSASPPSPAVGGAQAVRVAAAADAVGMVARGVDESPAVPAVPSPVLCGGRKREHVSSPSLPNFVRADGGVRIDLAVTPRGTRPMRIAESGGYRVRFPNADRCQAVLINTAGGMAGGDRMNIAVALGEGASATVTTQAAEKIYRSQAAPTEIAVSLALAHGSHLAWLPQEAILFSGSRVRRKVDIAMAEDASLVFAESVVFGRVAMGEVLGRGSFRDRWRLRRGGALVLAEDVRLDGALDRVLSRKAVAAGARALATVLVAAQDTEARLEEARDAMHYAACECGVSAWKGILLARFLSPDAQALRVGLVRFLERLRGEKMPRSWQT